MPSFDVVSEVNKPELSNALDQANREIITRYDFKGSDARVEYKENLITVFADSDFQVQQAVEVLHLKLAKRGIDLACLKANEIEEIGGGKARQIISVQEGISQDIARNIIKEVKASKIKVQASLQVKQLRISGKKRDELQQIIALLKGGSYELPLQFNNFRD